MQTDTDIRAGIVRVGMTLMEAEMTRTLLKSRVEELEKMEREHTVERGYACGCSSQVIGTYINVHSLLTLARRESCIDCSVGEVCRNHMTLL